MHRDYYVINEAKSWDQAQSYCRENYTDLATIGSHDDMKRLVAVTEARGLTRQSWIGLRETGVGSWLWSAGEAQIGHGLAEYTNWAGSPDSSHNCGGMRADGKWLSALCETTLPFVCQEGIYSQNACITKKRLSQNETTPARNVHNSHTAHHDPLAAGALSSLNQPAAVNGREQLSSNLLIFTIPFTIFTDVGSGGLTLILEEKSWREAQEYCRLNDADLANVRSQFENQALQQMINENASSLSLVWIGLFRDEWEWSDHSNSSLRYWEKSQPNNDGHCALYSPSQKKWFDRGCTSERSFICYKAREERKWIVRMEMKSNAFLKFSDSVVSKAILNQIQQKFEVIMLKWRVQPDGRIFHKKEEKKKINEACLNNLK
ncbi:lymphocyte antigen 75-like [Centropristis striata]|uniref:lymphocyte antigen 75-like n=1 Tax=Centropristis striata TaxID=184440 RepID=UPI0027DF2C95|nr:lymphocyte antigen 75-like [Centropristis striata]